MCVEPVGSVQVQPKRYGKALGSQYVWKHTLTAIYLKTGYGLPAAKRWTHKGAFRSNRL